jgi:hypothetical protein
MEDILTIFMLFSVALLCIVEHKDERDHSVSNAGYNYRNKELEERGRMVYKDAYEDTLKYHREVVKPGNNMFGNPTSPESRARDVARQAEDEFMLANR